MSAVVEGAFRQRCIDSTTPADFVRPPRHARGCFRVIASTDARHRGSHPQQETVGAPVPPLARYPSSLEEGRKPDCAFHLPEQLVILRPNSRPEELTCPASCRVSRSGRFIHSLLRGHWRRLDRAVAREDFKVIWKLSTSTCSSLSASTLRHATQMHSAGTSARWRRWRRTRRITTGPATSPS